MSAIEGIAKGVEVAVATPKQSAIDGIATGLEVAVATPKRPWRARLCGCFSDLGSCTLALLCPSVLFGLNQERAFPGESCCKWFALLVGPPLAFESVWYLGVAPIFVKHLEASMRDDDVRTACIAFGLFRMVCWLMTAAWSIHVRMARRAALRARLDVEGSAATDCAAVTVCGPCALAQEAREIKYSFVPVPVEHAPMLTAVQPIAEAVVVSA